MTEHPILIRKSPFYLVRLLVLVEFFFIFMPIFITFIFPVRAAYNQSSLAQSLSYATMSVLVLLVVQILVVALSFLAWYLPVYQIDPDQVAYKRAGVAGFKELIEIASVSCLSPQQGWLGRRFDFGDLLVYSNSEIGMVAIRDISDPIGVAIQLEEYVSNHWSQLLPPKN
jgi:membrane protein YdbS with pleckstrin-like domain